MRHSQYKVQPGSEPNLSKVDTLPAKKHDKEEMKAELVKCVEEISLLQYKLYAEDRQSLLIVLQGMDSSGKDGTIRQIMSGVNAQGVKVVSFKHPSMQELEHDFLWRHVQELPEHGTIVIFNRSHYENVLISKVHPEIVLSERLPGIDKISKITKKFWKERYRQINDFEKGIDRNGTRVLKFFLHMSKEEQRLRFLERIENKDRHWKFSSADITERAYWKQYREAYEDALQHTSTRIAPWYIIPADDKPFAHLLIARIIRDRLRKMDPRFPEVDKEEQALMKQAHEKLKRG